MVPWRRYLSPLLWLSGGWVQAKVSIEGHPNAVYNGVYTPL